MRLRVRVGAMEAAFEFDIYCICILSSSLLQHDRGILYNDMQKPFGAFADGSQLVPFHAINFILQATASKGNLEGTALFPTSAIYSTHSLRQSLNTISGRALHSFVNSNSD